MSDKQKTGQESRKLRNQVIAYAGGFVIIAAAAAAITFGIRHLQQPQQTEEERREESTLPSSQETSENPIQDEGSDAPSELDSTEKMEQVLKKMRPALVTLKGGEDGAGYTRGSGFIMEIQEDILYICTSRHIIEGLDSWEIGFYDGTTAAGIKTGISQVYDVGIVEVGTAQLPDELLRSLLVVDIDLNHWSSLDERTVYAGIVSMYQEEGSDIYMSGPLLSTFAEYPWEELRHSEFQIAFVNGDSGSAIFDEDGLLISMVRGTSFDKQTAGPRRWGVPLSGIMTCYKEIVGRKTYMDN